MLRAIEDLKVRRRYAPPNFSIERMSMVRNKFRPSPPLISRSIRFVNIGILLKLIQKITPHEMNRRFAIGEVHSNFFISQDEKFKRETLLLLNSSNKNQEIEGIKRHRQSRGSYIDSLPNDTHWYLSMLPLTESVFIQLMTIKNHGWENHTNGTFKLIDAAKSIVEDPSRDYRVSCVIAAFEKLELLGITLLVQQKDGPFTIVEGTARLIAHYIRCIVKRPVSCCAKEIEVVLGISKNRWCYS